MPDEADADGCDGNVADGASSSGPDPAVWSPGGGASPEQAASAAPSASPSILRRMVDQPPPPPGWTPPTGGAPYGAAGHDPYAADRALAAWATQRGFELSPSGDVRYYHGWLPFQYLPRFDRVGRELKLSLGDAKVALVEAYDSDPIKQAANEHLHVIAFVLTPRVQARVAVRSKQVGGLADGVSRGISAIEGFLSSGGQAPPPPGSVLGDPTLEARCDVIAPGRDEGNAALPMPLRHILVHPAFRGAIETRNGGMVVTLYDHRRFDPQGLDALLVSLRQIVDAASGPETAPAG